MSWRTRTRSRPEGLGLLVGAASVADMFAIQTCDDSGSQGPFSQPSFGNRVYELEVEGIECAGRRLGGPPPRQPALTPTTEIASPEQIRRADLRPTAIKETRQSSLPKDAVTKWLQNLSGKGTGARGWRTRGAWPSFTTDRTWDSYF